MGSFFDDISTKPEARRTNSFAMQKQMIESGLKTPSVVNNNYGLTNAQIEEKQQLLANSDRQAYSELMALPVGMVEGMVGFGGDIERLGRGVGGAITADNGNRWDSFLNELGNSDTTLWNTENVQGWTNRQLEGTEFGNRLLEGKGGRLVGEILAPIPPVAGALKYGGKGLDFLDDGITMKIGTLSDTENLLGFNTRKPIFKDNKLSYEVIRWEYENNESEPNEVFTLEWNYKTKKSAFDGLRRKPLGG